MSFHSSQHAFSTLVLLHFYTVTLFLHYKYILDVISKFTTLDEELLLNKSFRMLSSNLMDIVIGFALKTSHLAYCSGCQCCSNLHFCEIQQYLQRSEVRLQRSAFSWYRFDCTVCPICMFTAKGCCQIAHSVSLLPDSMFCQSTLVVV